MSHRKSKKIYKNKMERLQENWVKFSRYNCIEGFIDIWRGDCADNPNKETKSRWNLNSFITYIRKDNDVSWTECNYRRGGLNSFVSDMSQVATSDEIWNEIA